MPTFAGAGVILDLTNAVQAHKELLWSDISPIVRNRLVVYNKRVFMMPLDADAVYLFYRRDLLGLYSMAVPRTIDQLIAGIRLRSVIGKQSINQAARLGVLVSHVESPVACLPSRCVRVCSCCLLPWQGPEW